MERNAKSFIVKGNLKNKVSYQFLPNELTQGSWFISIQSLAYSIQGPGIQALAVITCNLVTSLQNYENVTKSVEQPFATVIFESKTKRKLVNFEAKWLNINVYSEELVISIRSLEAEQKIIVDCDVYFLVQLYKRE